LLFFFYLHAIDNHRMFNGVCSSEFFSYTMLILYLFWFQMCGNGVRCFARFIAELENLQGTHRYDIAASF